MEDRFTRGFLAGIIGGVFANIWSFIAGTIGMTTLRTADLIGVIFYAKAPPFGFGEVVFALFVHLLVTGVLGVAFSYSLLYVTNRNILFKGWLFSVTVWFTIFALTTFYEVPGTVTTPLKTLITSSISSTIYGLVLSYSLLKLSRNTKNNT